MKNIYCLFLSAALLFSCKSNKKPEIKDSTTTTKPAAIDQTPNIIERFKPIIQGVWVEKGYIEKMIKTKSPLAAITEADDHILICINTKQIKGDSLIALSGNTHEGGQMTIKFKNGKSPSTIKVLEGGEIGYSINKGDTILYYSRFDEQTKKLITTKFLKVLESLPDDNDEQFGLNYAINKAIITGNYMLTDSTGKVSKVSFDNAGKISGFSDFNTYQINFDLNSEPMDNLDEIFFKNNKNLSQHYSFKFSTDTLSLYTTHPNSDSTLLLLGKRVYKLVKQK